MILPIQSSEPVHLTYCLNVHPGETWADHLHWIRHSVPRIRERVCPRQPFGLGLRLGATAAETLSDAGIRQTFTDILAAEHLYVFTINGFPYGPFHGQPVKKQVYEPDWSTSVRREYTMQLIDLLADLLPEGVAGSISTVPVGFGDIRLSTERVQQAAKNLCECVAQCASIYDRYGCLIHIGLEPEPSCFLETSGDVVRFFEDHLLSEGSQRLAKTASLDKTEAERWIRRHVGVCLDTCHCAVEFEDLIAAIDRYQQSGILISKIQLSAALATCNSPSARSALTAFDEPVYLHQVRARPPAKDGKIAWLDLPQALDELGAYPDDTDLRVHFHVPLYWSGSELLHNTTGSFTAEFWKRVRSGLCPHLEVETYTFDVLPAPADHAHVPHQPELSTIESSVVAELNWVKRQLA